MNIDTFFPKSNKYLSDLSGVPTVMDGYHLEFRTVEPNGILRVPLPIVSRMLQLQASVVLCKRFRAGKPLKVSSYKV